MSTLVTELLPVLLVLFGAAGLASRTQQPDRRTHR